MSWQSAGDTEVLDHANDGATFSNYSSGSHLSLNGMFGSRRISGPETKILRRGVLDFEHYRKCVYREKIISREFIDIRQAKQRR